MSSKLARAPSRTKEFWLNHIKQWNNSGLSKAAYCRENNLSAGNFYNWFSKESLDDDSRARINPTTSLKFMPVTVANTVTKSTMITLESNGLMFGFPADLSADEIERWLTAIERRRV